MTFLEAYSAAVELNAAGRFRAEWYYYPAYNDGGNPNFHGEHFVMRRRKNAEIRVAVYEDGTKSISEGSDL